MKHLLLVTIVLFFYTTNIFAQVGKYIYESDESTETLEIRGDGTFEYTNKTTWAKSITQGTWKNNGGSIMLKSNYQLSDYVVIEEKNEDIEGKVAVVIGGEAKGNAPKKIRTVYAIAQDSTTCTEDYDRVMAAYENRQKLQIGGTPEEKEHIKNSDLEKFFLCENATTASFISVDLGNDVMLTHEITDANANQFVFQTTFSPSDTYRYFNDDAFVMEKKHIKELSSNKLYKWTKK